MNVPSLRGSRRLLVGVASVLALSGALASCGSDDEPAAGSGGTTGLTLQSAWINDAEFMGFYVGIDNGYYEDEGIDLEYLPGGPDVLPEGQLLTGKADIALSTPDSTTKAIIEQGAPFKIIGTLFQKSPLGVLSLADGANITSPEQLIGKTIAAGTAATVAVEGMLTNAGIPLDKVKIVPYSFDPQVVIDGKVDAAAEFCPDTPYVIEQEGAKPVCTLFADMGYNLYNDTVVVTEDTLKNHRDELVGFLKASRQGWEENFKDPKVYPPKFKDTWFKGTGRTIDHETYYNEHSEEMIANPTGGLFTMNDSDVDDIVEQLNKVGIKATKDMFDLTVMDEVNK